MMTAAKGLPFMNSSNTRCTFFFPGYNICRNNLALHICHLKPLGPYDTAKIKTFFQHLSTVAVQEVVGVCQSLLCG